MQQCFLFAGVCWLQVCAAHATRPQLPVLLKMEPVQPRRMTYAEQLEAMRPPCGFCILADGTILLSNRPETYTAEMVVDAYEAWRKMKANGLVRETRPAAQWVYYWNKSDIHHLLKMARGSMYIFLQETQPAAQWAACFLYRSNIHHESAMTMTRRHTAQWAAWWTCDRSMNSISSLRIKVRKKHDLISFGVN